MTINETAASWRHSIPIEHIHPSPHNPREEFDPEYIKSLSESIRVSGLRHPILVYPIPGRANEYWIEDGECRWLAMKGWCSEIPANIRPLRPGDIPAIRNISTALTTGIHRRDLGPIEKAKAYGRLRDEFGMNNIQISELAGVHSSSVSDFLTLLDLSEDAQDKVRKGKLSVTEAKKLVRRKRARDRKSKGHGQPGAVWEPDHLSKNHPLARKAGKLCDARGHTQHRRLGGIACGQCWETAIREDERLVVEATRREAEAWRALQPMNES